MKITLGELRDSRKALDILFNKELNISLAFKLSKLLKSVDKEIKDLEEFRTKLIQKYGTHDKEKNTYMVAPENQDKFYEEFGKLLDTKVNIDFTKMPLGELGDIKITPKQLLSLEPFIKEK